MIALTDNVDVYVREKAFSRFARETQVLNKVVGIADLVAWQQSMAIFNEIAPTTVKKLLTGSGKAEKVTVAKALERYLDTQVYKTDDESDAAAVGVAWLLQNNLLKKFDNS